MKYFVKAEIMEKYGIKNFNLKFLYRFECSFITLQRKYYILITD